LDGKDARQFTNALPRSNGPRLKPRKEGIRQKKGPKQTEKSVGREGKDLRRKLEKKKKITG